MLLHESIQYRETPWKNGGGTTAEVLTSPAGASLDDFDWRISMASIDRDGPFSSFPGIDRVLVLLTGVRLDLRIGVDEPACLTHDAPVARFTGEEPVYASLPRGPVTDFNIMARRNRCRARLNRIALNGVKRLGREQDVTIVFLAHGGPLRIRTSHDDLNLNKRDTVLLEHGDPDTFELTCTRPSTVFMVEFEPAVE